MNVFIKKTKSLFAFFSIFLNFLELFKSKFTFLIKVRTPKLGDPEKE